MKNLEFLKAVNLIFVSVPSLIVLINWISRKKTNKNLYAFLSIVYIIEAYIRICEGKSIWFDIVFSLVWIFNYWIADMEEKNKNEKPSE